MTSGAGRAGRADDGDWRRHDVLLGPFSVEVERPDGTVDRWDNMFVLQEGKLCLITNAVTAALQNWLPTYLAEMCRLSGRNVGDARASG
jgi:hypothetical protein